VVLARADTPDLPLASLPEGFRDYAPGLAEAKRRVEDRLLGEFRAWGYREVLPATLETRPDVGDGQWDGRLFRVVGGGGQNLALRPDLTLAVARMAGGSLAGWPLPVRICILANVFRDAPAHRGRAREVFQAGAELIGAGEPWADAEVIALAASSLRAAGVRRFRVGVGHVGLVSGALEAEGVSRAVREEVWRALRRGDLVALDRVLTGGAAPSWLADLLLGAGRFRSDPAWIGGLVDRLPPGRARAAAADLKAVVELLGGWGLGGQVAVDPGVTRDLGYYSGPVFEIYAEGVPTPVGGGGRYDGLVALDGRPLPATGFALGVTELLPVVEDNGAAPALDYLVLVEGGRHATAARLAQSLRRRGFRVALEPLVGALEERLERASAQGVRRVLVYGTGGYREVTPASAERAAAWGIH